MKNMPTTKKELYKDILEVCNPLFLSSLADQRMAKDTLRQLMKVDILRARVVEKRLRRSIDRGELRTLNHDNKNHIVTPTGKTAIEHNLEGVFNDTSSARSARIIRPLSCLECLRPLSINNRPNGALSDIDVELPIKVLCIGPRTESEVLLLWSYGFALETIEAIDLISYSPLIKLGDMHSLQYNDNTFDVIFSSCTLVYSRAIEKAISEIKRVAKNNAVIAVSQDILAGYDQESLRLFGKIFYDPESIMDLFIPKPEREVLFRHFARENVNKENGTTSTCIFRRKLDEKQER